MQAKDYQTGGRPHAHHHASSIVRVGESRDGGRKLKRQTSFRRFEVSSTCVFLTSYPPAIDSRLPLAPR